MKRLSLFASRHVTALDEIGDPYDRAAAGWQSGLLRIGFDDAIQWMIDRLTPGSASDFAISRLQWCMARVRWEWAGAAFRESKVAKMLGHAGVVHILPATHRKWAPLRVSCGYLARKANGLCT